jgi:hypothetical protein
MPRPDLRMVRVAVDLQIDAILVIGNDVCSFVIEH